MGGVKYQGFLGRGVGSKGGIGKRDVGSDGNIPNEIKSEKIMDRIC